MAVLDEALIEIIEYIEQAVDVDAVKLAGAYYIDRFAVVGIDYTRNGKVAAHGVEREVSRYRHLVLNQQVAFDASGVEFFIAQGFYIAVEVEIYIGRDAELVILLRSGRRFAEADGKELVQVQQVGVQIGFDADGLVLEQDKCDYVFEEPVEQKVAVADGAGYIAQGKVVIIELQAAIEVLQRDVLLAIGKVYVLQIDGALGGNALRGRFLLSNPSLPSNDTSASR